MADQGNLFSTRDEPATAVQPVPEQRQRQIPRWLLVMEIVLFVIVRLYVGALVVLLPWRSIWTTNAWIMHWPTVAAFLAQGWVRGLVSGLGLLNIWVALSVLFRPRHRQ
jgi:hypothetical protein